VHKRRRTGVELLKLVIFHLVQRRFTDIMRRVAFMHRVQKNRGRSIFCITSTNVDVVS